MTFTLAIPRRLYPLATALARRSRRGRTKQARPTLGLSLHSGLTDSPPSSELLSDGLRLLSMGYVLSLGFVTGSGKTRWAVSWNDPTSRSDFWSEIDFRSGEIRSSAPSALVGDSFGLLAIGAALTDLASAFRDAWLAVMPAEEVRPFMNDEAGLDLIAHALGSAIASPDVGICWTAETDLKDKAPAIVDLRNHLMDPGDFGELWALLGRTPAEPSRFQGPELGQLRSLIRRRKHTVLLGPPGVGKTFCAIEALQHEGLAAAGQDFQLFAGHDDVKSSDFLGAWQPTGTPGVFRWVDGALVRAMTANGGRGQPILVEEFTRMPRKAQNIFTTALSDGYVVLNEKPTTDGAGEIMRAGPDFVLLADMNVDAGVDDIELYGAAFASRVRKIRFDYPSEPTLRAIVTAAVPESSEVIRRCVARVYTQMLDRFRSAEVLAPLSPRSCIHWLEELLNALPTPLHITDSVSVRRAAVDAAEITWLWEVLALDTRETKLIRESVEAEFRKGFAAVRA